MSCNNSNSISEKKRRRRRSRRRINENSEQVANSLAEDEDEDNNNWLQAAESWSEVGLMNAREESFSGSRKKKRRLKRSKSFVRANFCFLPIVLLLSFCLLMQLASDDADDDDDAPKQTIKWPQVGQVAAAAAQVLAGSRATRNKANQQQQEAVFTLTANYMNSSSSSSTSEAMIDQDYEVGVADQLVSADNDALFKCQLAAKARQLYQLVGWIEESATTSSSQQQQQLEPASKQQHTGSSAALWAQFNPRQRGVAQAGSTTLVLPDGQLLVQHAQVRDSNKAYRCQLRNQLTSQVSLSPLAGRLFVTENNEQVGRAPRIIEGPKPVSLVKAGEQVLLVCVAQASPRPTIRWFRQSAPTTHTDNEHHWIEIHSQQQQQTSEFAVSHEANFLLLKQLDPINYQRAKFKCQANNSFGVHHVETELKFATDYPKPAPANPAHWPNMHQQSPQKLIELEPKVELISDTAHAHSLTFNCTVRIQQQQQQPQVPPLLALEWLKDGRRLFSIALTKQPILSAAATPTTYANHQQATTETDGGLSLFQDPNQELTLIEYDQQTTANDAAAASVGQLSGAEAALADVDSLEAAHTDLDQSSLLDTAAAIHQPANYIASQTTLNKLLAQNQLEDGAPPIDDSDGRGRRIKQKLTLIQVAADGADTSSSSSAVQFQQPQIAAALLYQLHLSQVRRADKGTYQCRARFARSKTLQASGQLVLKDNPPQFIETFNSQLITTKYAQQQQQQQHQASNSAQVSLKCVVSGSPLPEISWSLSGFPLPDSSRFRVGDYVTRDGLIVSFVHISQVQVEDGGLYECSASNDAGQLRHSAWLNVTGPAHVRSMPNVSAIAGSSLVIMCPVGGWPIEQISWFQNSSKLPLNHRQKLFNNGTLIINDLNEVTDSGQYYCQARAPNSDIAALNHVYISIKVPPVLEPFSFAKSLHRGQRYNIMCTVVRGDLPVSIRWLKDNRALDQVLLEQQQQQQQQQEQAVSSSVEESGLVAVGGGIAVKHLDPYSSTLTFASLQAQHRGLYTCEATNEAGKANQSSTLVIHVPPEWKIEPRDLSVTLGKTAVIDCQAHGSPPARIEWRLSSQEDLFREPPTEFKPIISSLYMRVFENGSLIIYNTQRSDAGYYLCQANNGVGAGLSRVIKLTVNVAAHFKSKIRTELVRRGQAARLKCEAIGDLPVEINWLRDKMPLYAGDEQRYSLSKSQLSDGLLSELNIIETDRIDSALFTCLTQNQFGSDDTNIQLIVQGPPDAPLDIRIHEYEARSVKISWLPGHSGNSPVTKYVIMYAQSGANTNNPQQADLAPTTTTTNNAPTQLQQQQQSVQYVNASVSGNETSLLLSGLTPLTEYQFFMFAINALGSSRSPSNEPIKFRTDDEAPNGPAMFVKAHALSSRSIKVKWRAPERRAHFGSIAGFYVGYKLHRSNNNNNNHSPTASSSAAAVGNSPTAAAASTTTTAVATLDTFTYKTVEFSFGTAGSSGTPIQQTMGVASDGNNRSALVQLLEQECVLTGLRRGQKYLITVQAFNSRGAGPASEPVICETWRIDVPEPPILRMVQRTARSIHLAWRVPQAATLGLLAASSGQAAAVNNPQQQQQAAAIVRKNINDHIKSRPMFAAVRGGVSTNELNNNMVDLSGDEVSGDSDSASPDSILMSSDSLMPSSGLPAALVEEEGAEARELAEAQANEPILGFVLTRKQLSNNNNNNVEQQQQQQQQHEPVVETRLPSDHLSQIVDQLTCGTRYQFTVSALNSVGMSAASEPLVAKTEGSTPVAPDQHSLLQVNATNSVLINLAAWHNGACAMRSFDIMFKASRSKKWSPLTNYQISSSAWPTSSSSRWNENEYQANNDRIINQQNHSTSSSALDARQKLASVGQPVQRSTIEPQQQQQQQLAGQVQPNSTILLEDLSEQLNYDLKIIATNEAGSTEALYTFNTNSINSKLRQSDQTIDGSTDSSFGVTQFSEQALAELLTSATPLLPFILLLVFLLLALSASCLLVARRRHASSSNCSLSLSSASRSNQSSGNYYTAAAAAAAANNPTAAAGQLLAKTTSAHSDRYAPVCGSSLDDHFNAAAMTLSARKNHQTNNSMTLQHHHEQRQHLILDNGSASILRSTGGATNCAELREESTNSTNQMQVVHHQHHHHHLAEHLYSAVAQQQAAAVAAAAAAAAAQNTQLELELTEKSVAAATNYAYLSGSGSQPPAPPTSASSPHQTDLTSLINGGSNISEAEMCLGASALNLNTNNDQADSNNSNNNKYYVSPAFLHQLKTNSSQQLAGRSSTLPGHCHQQILQQLMQQQQQQQEQDSNQQQNVMDTLMAANMIRQQQQQQCNSTDYSIQHQVPSNQQQQQGGSGEQAASMAAALMLEQQLQQQVYATVKRGCPKPPRPLCGGDYTIYQCPNQQQQQQQQQEGEQLSSMMRCCSHLDNQMQEQNVVCYHNTEQQQQQQQQICNLQQQQQITSDYQQLRPIN